MEDTETDLSAPLGLEVVTPSDSLFAFYNECKISSDRIKKREKGDKIVFQYYFKDTDYAYISDDAYHEEIQFEITPDIGQTKYFTNDPRSFNTTFDWRCFCDWPDSLEARQNEGKIELEKLNDTIWDVKLQIINKPLRKSKSINRTFKLYQPKFDFIRRDTINRTDRLNRKQGHWLTETYFTIENGIYEDNRFSGSKYDFIYYKDGKTLSSITIYEDNNWTESLEFNKFGKRIK
ncbi:MAG: hypothetical protein Kapaf2KO_11590 [Candidatus Kapaibacteriales bacterium]